MPRQPRLDAPGVLHQVMVRGIERRVIFRDETDHAAVVARLATSVTGTGLTVYAWALLPNHAHLLGHPGRPLAPYLGVQPAAIPTAARRGAATAGRWRQLLTEFQESYEAPFRCPRRSGVRAGVQGVSSLHELEVSS
jgi:hypothetical protein